MGNLKATVKRIMAQRRAKTPLMDLLTLLHEERALQSVTLGELVLTLAEIRTQDLDASTVRVLENHRDDPEYAEGMTAGDVLHLLKHEQRVSAEFDEIKKVLARLAKDPNAPVLEMPPRYKAL